MTTRNCEPAQSCPPRNKDLIAWPIAPGVCRVQCRCPKIAERLRKLRGAIRVGYAVAGPYLVLYDLPHQLAWVNRWVRKQENPPSNEHFFNAAAPTSAFDSKTGSECPRTGVGQKKTKKHTLAPLAKPGRPQDAVSTPKSGIIFPRQ